MNNITIKALLTGVLFLAPLVVSAQATISVTGGNGYACPALARICPDGSSATAQGPNCTITCPGVATTTSSPMPAVKSCVTLSRNIGEGAFGDDVSALQSYLTSLGMFTASQTGKFGPLTKSAVMQWQATQGIAQTGVVGPRTRAGIALHSCNTPITNATSTATTSIKIISMMPNTGKIGTTITLIGIGFTADNTIHFGASIIPHINATTSKALDCPLSNDPSCAPGVRKSISFTVPTMSTPACLYATPRCMIAQAIIAPRVYKVGVQNENGTSRMFEYTVTSQ